MKKIAGVLLLSFLGVSSTFASIEDNSIIDALSNNEKTTLKAENVELQTFQSCESFENTMEKYMKLYWEKNKSNYMRRDKGIMFDDIEMTTQSLGNFADESTAVSVKKESIGASSSDFSETNTQVSGVDESEIVKTDGKYIYYFNQEKTAVYIASIGEKKIVKKINIPKLFSGTQLYVQKGKLVIIASGYTNANYKTTYLIDRNSKTFAMVYDITDVKKLSFEKLYFVEGRLSKSRMIDGKLYLISENNFNFPYYSYKSVDDIDFSVQTALPKKLDFSKTADGKSGNFSLKGKKVPYNLYYSSVANCNDISYSLPSDETLEKYDFSPSYTIISVIDTQNIQKTVTTKVIVGSNAEVYMSLENLYLTSYMYANTELSCGPLERCIMPYYPRGANTLVHKLGVNGQKIDYKTSTIIPGTPLTQYSMDEHKENFRILTQVQNWNIKGNEKYTNLYILDKNLKLSGSLEKLGEGENFKSSRYMGDKLYLVTFQDIDPFYVIDVANPKAPKILGELKIPGYSSYLHPYDENHIIGLGYGTKDNGHGGVYNGGIKLDLYTVDYSKKVGVSSSCEQHSYSDCPSFCEKTCRPSTCSGDVCTADCDGPKSCVYKGDDSKKEYIQVEQKFSKTFGDEGSYSEALSNPRMFMWNARKNMLFLPASIQYTEEKYQVKDYFQGLLAVEINKSTGIKEKYRITHFNLKKLQKDREEECSKYTKKISEPECKTLLNGEKYCGPKKEYNSYIPEYCFKESSLGLYLSRNSWNYRQDQVKRALWVGNSVFSLSDGKIESHSLDTGKKQFSIDMK